MYLLIHPGGFALPRTVSSSLSREDSQFFGAFYGSSSEYAQKYEGKTRRVRRQQRRKKTQESLSSHFRVPFPAEGPPCFSQEMHKNFLSSSFHVSTAFSGHGEEKG